MATRLAAKRLREAGINLEPLLRNAGLSVGQINKQEARIGVASQIKFLELAAEALKDQLLGFLWWMTTTRFGSSSVRR